MKHLVVKFQSDDEQAMRNITSEICKAMSESGNKFHGVQVTAISRGDLFQQIEDIENAEDLDSVIEILEKPYL